MSLKTWLQGVEGTIVLDFEGLEKEVKNEILPIAYTITNDVKEVLDADTSDIISGVVKDVTGVNLAPYEDKLRNWVDVIVPDLSIAKQFMAAGTNQQILNAIIADLPNMDLNAKTLFLSELAARLTQYLTGDKITIQGAWALAQWYYNNLPAAESTNPGQAVADERQIGKTGL